MLKSAYSMGSKINPMKGCGRGRGIGGTGSFVQWMSIPNTKSKCLATCCTAVLATLAFFAIIFMRIHLLRVNDIGHPCWGLVC